MNNPALRMKLQCGDVSVLGRDKARDKASNVKIGTRTPSLQLLSSL